MGEGLNGGGATGRRRARGTVPGDRTGLELLLADALRETPPGDEREQRAVAAFRAARDAGEHRARTRHRDDWRPREQRRWWGRSARITLSVAAAGLTLGGVAVAAIGTGGSADAARHDQDTRPHTSAQPGTPSATAATDHPVTAQDTGAHCRSYEKLQGRGNALDSAVWKRLIDAAGGEGNVAAYCAKQLADEDGKTDKPAKGRNDNSGGTSGNGNGSGSGSGSGESTGKGKS